MLISSLFAWKQLSISIEETDFSSQVYLILAKIRSKNWDLNACDTIIVTVREKVPTHIVIISYKGMSPLYLLYVQNSEILEEAGKENVIIWKNVPSSTLKRFTK